MNLTMLSSNTSTDGFKTSTGLGRAGARGGSVVPGRSCSRLPGRNFLTASLVNASMTRALSGFTRPVISANVASYDWYCSGSMTISVEYMSSTFSYFSWNDVHSRQNTSTVCRVTDESTSRTSRASSNASS